MGLRGLAKLYWGRHERRWPSVAEWKGQRLCVVGQLRLEDAWPWCRPLCPMAIVLSSCAGHVQLGMGPSGRKPHRHSTSVSGDDVLGYFSPYSRSHFGVPSML